MKRNRIKFSISILILFFTYSSNLFSAQEIDSGYAQYYYQQITYDESTMFNLSTNQPIYRNLYSDFFLDTNDSDLNNISVFAITEYGNQIAANTDDYYTAANSNIITGYVFQTASGSYSTIDTLNSDGYVSFTFEGTNLISMNLYTYTGDEVITISMRGAPEASQIATIGIGLSMLVLNLFGKRKRKPTSGYSIKSTLLTPAV